jgi:hypothetical protein
MQGSSTSGDPIGSDKPVAAAALHPASATGQAHPARMTTAEVCELARYGPITLWRRIRAGRMPRPVDRGRQSMFDRDAVLIALGLNPAKPASNGIKTNPDAFRKARARQVRHSSPKSGR